MECCLSSESEIGFERRGAVAIMTIDDATIAAFVEKRTPLFNRP